MQNKHLAKKMEKASFNTSDGADYNTSSSSSADPEINNKNINTTDDRNKKPLTNMVSFSIADTVSNKEDNHNKIDDNESASSKSENRLTKISKMLINIRGLTKKEEEGESKKFIRNLSKERMNKMDLFHSAHHTSLELDVDSDHINLVDENYPQHQEDFFYILWSMLQTPTILVLTGVLAGLLTYITNLGIRLVTPLRDYIVFELYDHLISGLFIYILYATTLSVLSCYITSKICFVAVGGGVPEVKSVLSGLIHPSILTINLIFAKMIGLILAYSAGLSVGKLGPFVQMSVAIADLIARQRIFPNCRNNTTKRLEILACASAVGVAITFGTPFGGVLFSIEVTATAYMVESLPRAFFASLTASLVYYYMDPGNNLSLISKRLSGYVAYNNHDLFLIVGLGIVCGITGVIYVNMISKLCIIRNNYLKGTLGKEIVLRRRLIFVFICTLFIAPMIYFDLRFGIHGSSAGMIAYMFQMKNVGVSGPLLLYIPFKLIVTIVSVSMPLPVGLFTPSFIAGGSIGRLYGEVMKLSFQDSITFQPWEFALIGAAAFSSGVTRAISTAILLFELTGEQHLYLPLGVAIIISYFIGNRFTKNIYDAIMDTNGTPYLPSLPDEFTTKPASEIMMPFKDMHTLSYDSTFADVIDILHANPQEHYIAVVDSPSNRNLEGAVEVHTLIAAVEKFWDKSASNRSLIVREQGAGFNFNTDGTIDPSLCELNFVVVRKGHKYGGYIEAKTPTKNKYGWGINIVIDPSPYQVPKDTMMGKLDLVFKMLKLNQAFITHSGILSGVITRESLTAFIGAQEKHPYDTCSKLFKSFGELVTNGCCNIVKYICELFCMRRTGLFYSQTQINVPYDPI